ncbi:hypothetical protein [Piscirickettsia salmonis]|uniref:hypothetical protein n=1 Tax=Piscirickettsia salmonis TaxID=1238 RepID=UPI003A806081
MLGDFASLDVQNTYRGSDAYDHVKRQKHIVLRIKNNKVRQFTIVSYAFLTGTKWK